MLIGCYTLDLYCDNDKSGVKEDGTHDWREFPHPFTGETFAVCAREARGRGWIISKNHDLCPKCSGKVRDE